MSFSLSCKRKEKREKRREEREETTRYFNL